MDITRYVVREMNDIAMAKAQVEAVIGHPVMACDSADQVYLRGLQALGHTTPIPASAARAMWMTLRGTPKKTSMAMDAKTAADAARFPGASKLKLR
jgi:hypothetical protein